MSDEDVQRAIRTIERHGQQVHVILALLPSIMSNDLLSIKNQADSLQSGRLTELRYAITAPGRSELVFSEGGLLHMDLYTSLKDVYLRWVIPKHPRLLTPENVRYAAYYQTYWADPDKECDGEGVLLKGVNHIEIHVKRCTDSQGNALR